MNMKYLSSCPLPTLLLLFLSLLCTDAAFDSLLLLPSNITRPRSKRTLLVTDFGAVGDGLHDDTQALKFVWEIACSYTKRTTIIIPAGFTLLTRPIDFNGPCKSKITLVISGTIVAPEDPDIWKGLDTRKWLYFDGVNHLHVQGGGTINGVGREWWARSCKINASNPCQHAPNALTFHKCKNLKVKNIMLINSQQMHLIFNHCLRVKASHLEVLAPAVSPNTDGIHITGSRGVDISDSIVATGDDCVSIVNNSTRIKIRNIFCGPGHGISIGSLGKYNAWAQVSNVVVDGAFISDTENGVRIKTWQGGSGYVRDISFQNILMYNVANPIIIDQYYCDQLDPCENQTLAVKVENISFKHIKGTSATEESIRFVCSDILPCRGLYLEDVQLMSPTGENTTSFCWEASGSSDGVVQPLSCLTDAEGFIQQMVPMNFSSLSF